MFLNMDGFDDGARIRSEELKDREEVRGEADKRGNTELLLAQLVIPQRFTDPEKFGGDFKAAQELSQYIIDTWKIEEWMHKVGGIADLCPDYDKRDNDGRSQFWVLLLTAVMAYESEYNPSLVFFEGDHDARKDMQKDSVGLFQLSLDGKARYGHLDGWMIETADDLKSPYKNTSSAFAIMKFLTKRDGTIGEGTRKGLGAYWSAMRDQEKAETKYGKYQKLRATIAVNLAAQKNRK